MQWIVPRFFSILGISFNTLLWYYIILWYWTFSILFAQSKNEFESHLKRFLQTNDSFIESKRKFDEQLHNQLEIRQKSNENRKKLQETNSVNLIENKSGGGDTTISGIVKKQQ